MSPATIVIKKYPNRRLYDTSASRYINLEDIGEMIRKGKDVQVVDAQTGADVTRVTLTQIIVDDAKQQPTGLPLELLRQLIVSSDEVGREFIMWYLKSAFDAYQARAEQAAQRAERDAVSCDVSHQHDQELHARTTSRNSRLGGPQWQRREVQQLRERIAELEARVEKPKRRKRLLPNVSPRKK